MRAYWRRFFGLKSAPGTDRTHALLSIGLKSDAELDPDYDGSVAVSEGIIAAGVILFLACLMVGAVAIALTAYLKPSLPRQYVVQSGFVEIIPKRK